MIPILFLIISLFPVNLQFETSVKKEFQTETRYIQFELLNKSAKSIPLIIPGVMNPNLSPFSSSGLSLKVGQKIYFKEKNKRYLLLEVDGTLLDQKVNVSELLKKRKKELVLKN